MAGLNLVEALIGVQQMPRAIEQARHVLAVLERRPGLDPLVLDSGHFPPAFDDFRVEWELAGWAHAGRPGEEARAKRDLLRWRLHLILGELTGNLAHHYEAALARPVLPVTQAALGQALARANQHAEAVVHERRALEGNPFDVNAARVLFQVLGAAGDGDGQRRLARDRRLLHRAAPEAVPEEPWFMRVPPVGDELASIIIPCCNQVDYTRRCLESVLGRTRQPYELVVVDNGSTDGTRSYLKEVEALAGSAGGPLRVDVIHNDANRGFPTACNEGLSGARGRYVIFLNNDTVVTEGWLDGLVRWSLYDWPKVALVGPVTNNAPAPQQVAIDYGDLDRLEAFAARQRRQFAGKALQVQRLTGFCLLARREVLEQVGGFDEGYGLGFFDDDDLGMRVRKAGFQTLVAQEVFIHHFGSRTFRGLGVDIRKALVKNHERFKAKWGAEEAARYRFAEDDNGEAQGKRQEGAGSQAGLPSADRFRPSAQPRLGAGAGDPVERPLFALVMIVKDEEKNLGPCLESVRGLFDKVVITDTGSTDRTVQLAEEFGAQVVHFPWVDDFAAARNAAQEHAGAVMSMWMDADDRLDEENRQKLGELFAKIRDLVKQEAPLPAFSMKCECQGADGEAPTVVDHVRLFPNHPDLRWEFRVHEQVLGSLRRLGIRVLETDVVIQHTGYADPPLRQRKRERDLRLLQLQEAERPGHPFTLFNMGSIASDLGRTEEALALFRRSLARSNPEDSIVRKLYAWIAHSHRRLGKPDEALAACRQGRGWYPDDLELLFQEGMARFDVRDLDGAEGCLLEALATREKGHFASVDAGLRGYKTRQNLGIIYREQGRAAEAEAQWRAALEEQPDFQPALLELGSLLLSQGRLEEAEAIIQRLEAGRQPAGGAVVLRARLLMARKDHAGARQLLEEAVARTPEQVRLWMLLSYALLQQGKDLDAAERVLRKILELDPANVEARSNLAILLHQQGRTAKGAGVQGPSLAQLYHQVCALSSDINEHCPTLCALARECRHVTEFGTRTGNSTVALLNAQPDKLVCYDLVRSPQMERLRDVAGRTELVFVQADVLQVEIEPTDMLFIDTRHDYEQLKEELRRHTGKVRRYIVLHDTTTYAERGETPGHAGLWPAVEEFMALGTFRLKWRDHHNNGLTVLEPTGG